MMGALANINSAHGKEGTSVAAGRVTEHLCESEASQRLSVPCKSNHKYLHAFIVIHMTARTEAQERQAANGENRRGITFKSARRRRRRKG